MHARTHARTHAQTHTYIPIIHAYMRTYLHIYIHTNTYIPRLCSVKTPLSSLIFQASCTLSYNGQGNTGWYAVALMLEDFYAGSVTFNSSAALSNVGLQFLIKVDASSSCNLKPYLRDTSPADGGCVAIPTGQTYRATLEASHNDSTKRQVFTVVWRCTASSSSCFKFPRVLFISVIVLPVSYCEISILFPPPLFKKSVC